MGRTKFDLARTRLGLFAALLRAKAEHGGTHEIMVDADGATLTYDGMIRAALALGAKFKRFTKPGERVGLLLPTSLACTVAFFALHAIGRRPVMLNFSSGSLNLEAGCKAAGVTRILSAHKFIEIGKLEKLVADLGRFVQITYLEDVRATVGLVDKLAALLRSFNPGRFIAKTAPDDEGVLLFTSGSFGAPRGVLLTQANIVANIEQVYAHIDFDPSWIFFNPLPMFHCFGLTGGALLPILTGHKVFLYPSPLHFKEIPPHIQRVGANVLFTTDTFAMQYARSAKDGELACLKFAVLGAERVKDETRALYQRKFGVPLLEGYGATEAAPVIAVNQPDDNRAGTVGPMLPGIEHRLEPIPGVPRGAKLLVRGPNVMKGYLNADGALEAPPDGWHDTGDVVEFDQDGYITILGRVKRFAKIGGEMVSLSAVEGLAAGCWPRQNHAAVAVPDQRKGERIILFTDQSEADSSALLAFAQTQGAPEIAVPKKIVIVPEIPALATGKTDYVSLQRIAEERAAEAA